jgi:lipopolysaccharide/colanic/teichoic acid biosynthesis glycosyltransferase
VCNDPLFNSSVTSQKKEQTEYGRKEKPRGDVGRPPAVGWKRTLDVVCCLGAMPVFVVLTFFFATLVALTSPGPVIFRQERVGYRGRRFLIYKFRTMHVGANVAIHQAHWSQLIESGKPMQKLDAHSDTRMIPGAWLLRAMGLDELPQIVNVLRGEMSIVGPRPCLPYEYECYSSRERKRCDAVPGLTGLWQVSGKNSLTFSQMVELDIRYAVGKSLWLDLRIILLTLPALFVQICHSWRARLVSRDRAGAATAPPARF